MALAFDLLFIQAVADSVGGREEVGRLQAVAQGLADSVPGGRGDDLDLGPVIVRPDEPDNVGLVGAASRGRGRFPVFATGGFAGSGPVSLLAHPAFRGVSWQIS